MSTRRETSLGVLIAAVGVAINIGALIDFAIGGRSFAAAHVTPPNAEGARRTIADQTRPPASIQSAEALAHLLAQPEPEAIPAMASRPATLSPGETLDSPRALLQLQFSIDRDPKGAAEWKAKNAPPGEGHARNVFTEVTEVPFVISFPFRIEPGTRNVDIWPTPFDRLGLPTNPDTDGRSLVPERLVAARGEPAPAPDPVGITHIDQNWGQRNRKPPLNVAVRGGTLRDVRLPDGSAPVEQLFDVARDPRELDDLAAAQPETVAKLRAIADGYPASRPRWGNVPRRQLEELELNQLRALG